MLHVLEGLQGVEVMIDDILVWGETVQQHDERLQAVLQRCRDVTLTLNKAKCKSLQTEMRYLGNIFSDKGLQVDPERVSDILRITRPQNTEDLESFLGVITYVNRFIPRMAQFGAPLRELLKKGVSWSWDEHHDSSFQALREALIKAPVLRFYDKQEPLTLSVDASSNGLGVVLLQGGQPVAYSSRSLRETQARYAQIEKELLAILHG